MKIGLTVPPRCVPEKKDRRVKEVRNVLGEKPPLNWFAPKFAAWLSSPHNYVCKVYNWICWGLRFYRGQIFDFPIDSCMSLRCLWLYGRWSSDSVTSHLRIEVSPTSVRPRARVCACPVVKYSSFYSRLVVCGRAEDADRRMDRRLLLAQRNNVANYWLRWTPNLQPSRAQPTPADGVRCLAGHPRVGRRSTTMMTASDGADGRRLRLIISGFSLISL